MGDETALLLKSVFDRIEMPPFEQIPDVSTVESQGLAQWTVPNTPIKIVLMEKGPRQGEFLFSAGTVASVREYYEQMVAFVPDPRVRFRQFGDSALEFELLCWARRPEDQGRLVHELNQQIYKDFADTGIEIPFPQRDVHLKPQPRDSEPAAPSLVSKNNG